MLVFSLAAFEDCTTTDKDSTQWSTLLKVKNSVNKKAAISVMSTY